MGKPTRPLLFEKLPGYLPIRKSLLDIPEDVYLCIFDYIIKPRRIHCGSYQCSLHISQEEKISYRRLLSNLTLVCRFFAIVFSPLLLHSMPLSIIHPSLSPRMWILDRCQKESPGRFARVLARDNRLACSQMAHVKECTLISRRKKQHRFCPKEAKFLVTVTGKLPRTMQCLFFRSACINDKLFTTLGALTNLTSLAFSHVYFSSQLVFPRNVQLRLVSFSLFDIKLMNPFSAFATMESLCHFICSGSTETLRALYTDDEDFLRAIMKRPCVPSFEELEIDLLASSFIPTLLYHLSQISSLKTLSITAWFFHSRNTPSTSTEWLLPSSMPGLQHLDCPAFMAPSFISGRPLKTVDLYYFQDRFDEEDLEDLAHIPATAGLALFRLVQQSTAALETLRIPAHVWFASSHLFGDAFPHLTELVLRFPATLHGDVVTSGIFTKHISTMCSAPRTSTPPITRLTLVFVATLSECQWAFNLALQAEMIALLHSTFPTLLCVEFSTNYDKGWMWNWQYDCQNTIDFVWKPSIGRASRANIRDALQLRPSWYPNPDTDFTDTFAMLFSAPTTQPRGKLPWP